MTEGDVTNLGRIDLGARHRVAYHGGGHIDRRGVLECAAEGTDCGAHTGKNHYVTLGHDEFSSLLRLGK